MFLWWGHFVAKKTKEERERDREIFFFFFFNFIVSHIIISHLSLIDGDYFATITKS